MNKVIVIGLDGLEPRIAETLLAARELPNLARLQEQGGYTRVRTTCPAQTPVAWSTFSTGTNPGGHGIFDFLSRDPKTYLPILGLSRYEQKSAFALPRVVNQRRGTPIWELLSKAGIPSTVLRCPCTYPPDPVQGRMLAGVGVPDLRGGLGTATYYTSMDHVKAGNGERVVQVEIAANGTIATHLIGPRNPKTRSDFTLAVVIQLDAPARKVILRSEGQPNALTIQVGQWSDWLRVKFKIGLLQSVRGIVRFYLRQIEPVFELYASPINFDPEEPLFPISAPEEYAGEIQARQGTFYTSGMPEEHDGLINGRFDEAAYLDQCALVMREREQMMTSELGRFSKGLFFCLYDTPDRLQHMFWRFREPDHPANQTGFSPDMARVIQEHYRTLDTLVGKAMQFADEQTLLIVLSDHGMTGFRRGLNLNTWLYDNGLLALKNGKPGGDENAEFFRNVDWSRTKAYALGLAGIFLNLKGREAQGSVPPAEAEPLKAAIAKALTGLRDPQAGQAPIRSVWTREQAYRGPYASESPDLIVNFAEGYRMSWSTPLGGIAEGLFEDNTKKWAGDHVVDPDLIPGVLWMNRRFKAESASLLDMAPTILSALGVEKGPAMEGENLLA